jgi:hypothetical protein
MEGMTQMSVRAFSYGGGVQSTACLALAVAGTIDYKTFLFANVGADSEHPDTLDYVYQHAMPYAKANGIDLIEVRKIRRDSGKPETILERLERLGSSIPLPVRMEINGAPGNRTCTVDYKIKPIAKWFREHGATADDPGIAGIGISLDEAQRAKPCGQSGITYQRLEYPLLDLGLNRSNCVAIIERAGLPVPPKSACFFCPFHTRKNWEHLKATRPDLFDKACLVEGIINRRGQKLGRGEFWLTAYGKPLAEAIGKFQPELPFEYPLCESGHCFV